MLRCRLGLLSKIFSFTVLNCFLGENFINITSISSNGGAGEYCAFFKLHMRTTNSVVERWPFPRPQPLQPSHLPVLVDRLLIHWVSGFLLIALWNGWMRITSKNLYIKFSPTQSELRTHRAPQWHTAHSSTRLKAPSKLACQHHVGQATGLTLRNWETGRLRPPWCTGIRYMT